MLELKNKTKQNTDLGAREMVQSVKCLTLSIKTQIQSPEESDLVLYTCNPSVGEAEMGRSLELIEHAA